MQIPDSMRRARIGSIDEVSLPPGGKTALFVLKTKSVGGKYILEASLDCQVAGQS
jgi:hypothetical protein